MARFQHRFDAAAETASKFERVRAKYKPFDADKAYGAYLRHLKGELSLNDALRDIIPIINFTLLTRFLDAWCIEDITEYCYVELFKITKAKTIPTTTKHHFCAFIMHCLHRAGSRAYRYYSTKYYEPYVTLTADTPMGRCSDTEDVDCKLMSEDTAREIRLAVIDSIRFSGADYNVCMALYDQLVQEVDFHPHPLSSAFKVRGTRVKFLKSYMIVLMKILLYKFKEDNGADAVIPTNYWSQEICWDSDF